MPKNILDSDSGSDVELKINKSYADNYDSWRRKEELQKFKDRFGKDALDNSEEDRSSTSSSDGDTDMENTELFDKEFYHTLSCLKAKDPRIYDKTTTFFENVCQLSKNERRTIEKTKPMYLRDYERNLILEKGGVLSDEDSELETNADPESGTKIGSPSYIQEQEALKKSFKVAIAESQKNEDDEQNSIGGLFSKKVKSSEEKTKEEDEYAAWLEGKEGAQLRSEEEERGLSVLRSYWTDPSLDAGEAFLRDYILQKKFTDKGKEGSSAKDWGHVALDDGNHERKEKDIEKIEEFEHKFNFRFEEPDQEFIKRFPRTMESTLRKKDDRRKEKRLELRRRKEAELQKHKEDLAKAKELKRKEVEARLLQLCTITGNAEVGFKGEDLETDFDPEEHDRRMNELFSQDSFYVTSEENKPEFPSIDEELDIEKWDSWDVSGKEREIPFGQDGSEVCAEGLHSEDPNFVMDCEFDPEAERASRSKRAKQRRRRGANSKLAKGLEMEKPLFDPSKFLSVPQMNEGSSSQAFEKYVDEYYGLEFEDVIGGDLPCRFKYRSVIPNDYGLTVEEILAADDKELNRWCSLKKALRIKPDENEKYDLQAYRKKSANMKLKQKIFSSLYSEGSDESVVRVPEKRMKIAAKEDSGEQSNDKDNLEECSDKSDLVMKEGADGKLQRKRSNKEGKGNVKLTLQVEKCGIKSVGSRTKKGDKLPKGITNPKKVKFVEGKQDSEESQLGIGREGRRRRKQRSTQDGYFSGISKSRLKAYGINPKKFKNKLIYKQPN